MAKRLVKKKQYKNKSKKRMGMSYPDLHNYKLAGYSTFISSGANGPVATGLVSIGGAQNNPPVAGPSGSNLWNFGGSFNFNGGSAGIGVPNTVPYFPALSNLYDRVRVNKIRVKIIPEINTAVSTGQSLIPTMKICYDYDDAQIPTVSSIWGRRGKVFRLDKPRTIEFVPRVNYATTTTTAGNVPLLIQKCPWLNTTNGGTVVMFGLKWAIKDFYSVTSSNNTIRFEIFYYYSFKEQVQGTTVGLYGSPADYGFHVEPPAVDYDKIDSSGNLTDSSGNLIYVNEDGEWQPAP